MTGPPMDPIRLSPPADPRPHVDRAGAFVKLVGGWLCLDFVNTVGAWVPGAGGSRRSVHAERLGDYPALLGWAVVSGALPRDVARRLSEAATTRLRRARAVLTRAHALREAVHRLASARVDGVAFPLDPLAVLEAEARSLARDERLVEADGTLETRWVADPQALEAPLWPVVRSALALFRDEDACGRLGRCDGERCGWLFVDVSRGRRRRWCDMADCGNLAKVRAHRGRARGAKNR